jgi:hypothetical protein
MKINYTILDLSQELKQINDIKNITDKRHSLDDVRKKIYNIVEKLRVEEFNY